MLELNYEQKGVRYVEPFCLGVTSTGYLGLRAFQTSGYTESQNDSWKLFDLEKATDIKVLSESFDATIRAGHDKSDKDMKIIYFKI